MGTSEPKCGCPSPYPKGFGAAVDRLTELISRVFAEWRFAAHIVEKELEHGDILVVDRTLQTAFKSEHRYLSELVKSARALFLLNFSCKVVVLNISSTENSMKQKVVDIDQAERYLSQGWQYVAHLPGKKVVIKSNSN